MTHSLPSTLHNHLVLRASAALFATSSLLFAQWVQQAPATHPSARRSAAMDYVPLNAGLLLFGGTFPNSAETWTYDGANWTLLTPAVSPSARFGAELVYDEIRGAAVLYGGLATIISVPPPTSETWEWDGTTWTQATPLHNPGPRYQYGACYDAFRGRTVLYGGSTSQLLIPPSNQTWEYDGVDWTQVVTTGNPGPRERPAMCFDQGIGKVVLFGGYTGSGYSNQTWLYDGFAGTWTQVVFPNGTPLPDGRNAAKMVYDAAHGVCVLVGGQNTNGILADTWTFDGLTWTQQSVAPQTTRDHSMAFLPTTSQVVRFGGFVAAPNTTSDETWALADGTFGAGCSGSNGVPTLAASGQAQVGQGWTLNVGGLDPAINVAVIVLGLQRAPLLDLGIIGMPGCTSFASPDLLVVAIGAGGAANWTWPVVSGPVGVSLFVQALGLDPAANALGLTSSNGLYATLTN